MATKINAGNFFEDFRVGQELPHATPRTITTGDVALYTALFGGRYALQSADTVAQALGLSRLDIGTEIAPGVPWTFATVKGEDVAVALKSGNFGDQDFFATALARLEA